MKIFYIYRWYSIKNFFVSLSIKEKVLIVCVTSILLLFLFGILSQFVHSLKAILLLNLQVTKNITPHILALAVLLSRLFIHPEKTLNRAFNDHSFYAALPINRESTLHWYLIVNLLKDCCWIILGIAFTLIVAQETNLKWSFYFSRTTQLSILWVLTASLISSVFSIMRIILASRLRFERKLVLKLLVIGEILFSILFFLMISYLRIKFTDYMTASWGANDLLISMIFFLTILSLLYLIITRLFSSFESEILRYFESENDYYSVKGLPKTIHKFILKCESPLTRSVIRLSLTTRAYGFTKFNSLVVILAQAIILLVFSITIAEASVSLIVFVICANMLTTSFFSAILASVPSLFTITRSLPLLFKDVTRSYIKGGLLLTIPAFVFVLLLSVFLGFNNSLLAIGLSSLLSLCIIPLRVFISLRYPNSRLLSDIALISSVFIIVLSSQLFIIMPIFGLIFIVLHYQKKGVRVWNANGQ